MDCIGACPTATDRNAVKPTSADLMRQAILKNFDPRGDEVRGNSHAVSMWVTYEQASEILGCHVSYVPKLIDEGQLPSRGRGPSLNRGQVEALAERRRRTRESFVPRPRRTLSTSTAARTTITSGSLSARSLNFSGSPRRQ